MEISVILPVFNEKENLAPVLHELEGVLDRLGRRYEIVAIDDGSTDGSSEWLAAEAAKRENFKLLVFRRNIGQAAAFDAGFRHATGQIIVTMDSDRQSDPADIPRLIARLEEGYEFVTGWRRDRKDDYLMRTLPSRIANTVIRAVTGTRLHDLGCSLKVYRREVTEELRLYGEMHRFISVLVETSGARVTELEVNHRPRVAGHSKYGLSRTFKVLLDLTTVWFMRGFQTKPIYPFGAAGLGLLALSVACMALTAYEKLASGVFVHRNPVFILGVMFSVIGIQFLGMGLIAELIIRTYFESQNKAAYTITQKIGFKT